MKNMSHDHLTAEGLLYLEAEVIMQAAMLAVMVVQWSQWCVYIDAICGVCTKNSMCLCTEFSIEHRAEIFSENNLIPLEKIYQLSTKAATGDIKMLLLIWKIGKANKVLNFSVYMINKIPTIFSNLEPGAWPKLVHAYLPIVFSATNSKE